MKRRILSVQQILFAFDFPDNESIPYCWHGESYGKHAFPLSRFLGKCERSLNL